VIPYSRQQITEADFAAVVDVLRSDFLTQGPVVPRFERAVAEYTGAEHAVATNSGTSALHLACLALGLGPGDRLWTSAITFVASANCGRYCGAVVDFVDIDPETYNLSIAALQARLVAARRAGELPKIVVSVHLGGQPPVQERVWELAQEFGFRVVEDASHALGATRNGERVGSCRWSDITVFSFHPVKIITTGEGGMALTNDAQLARRLTLLRSHGITREPAEMAHVPDGPWYYEQIDLGFNYRMTDFQGALGLSQLQRLDELVSRRSYLADRYDSALADLPVTTPRQDPNGRSAWHLYVIRLQRGATELTHRAVFEALRSSGIGVNLHYIPVYRQPYYERLGFAASAWPEAERYYSEAISLPLYPGLADEQQDHVIAALRLALT
jgi:UDP-4-amino-4,6-dideoxy-N-acetyl-beta-L-altrosamine transaminase